MQTKTEFYESRPVIIGSSITGLLVSLSLSREGIDHIMLGGKKPPEIPRLGESMNEVASPELWRLFSKELRQFFYPKSHISLLNGEFASMIYLNDPNLSLEEKGAVFSKDASSPLPKVLMHVDRAGFDAALYTRVQEDKCCTFIPTALKAIEYDDASDSIATLKLTDDSEICKPRYVFDTTGARGVVADAAKVQMTPISTEQRVVWTHYQSHDGDKCPVNWWCRGTNLLRLSKNIDSVDGISWLIPLGRKISIGCSFESAEYDKQEYDERKLMELLVAAYQRRGIRVADHFPEQQQIQDVTHSYFIRDRAYGRNWLLVGGTFVQIWFPSSAGIWTVSAAAGLAPRILEEPMAVGAHYEKIMRGLLGTHEHLERMIVNPPFSSEAEVYQFWSRWIAFIIRRRMEYVRIVSGDFLEPVRLAYRKSILKSWLALTFPRLRVLAFRRAICCRKVPEIGEQEMAFPNYFQPKEFWAKNRKAGLKRAVFSRA